jgi:hypothetical protein
MHTVSYNGSLKCYYKHLASSIDIFSDIALTILGYPNLYYKMLGRPVGPQKTFVEKYVGQVMMGLPSIWFILWAALVLVVEIFPTVVSPCMNYT